MLKPFYLIIMVVAVLIGLVMGCSDVNENEYTGPELSGLNDLGPGFSYKLTIRKNGVIQQVVNQVPTIWDGISELEPDILYRISLTNMEKFEGWLVEHQRPVSRISQEKTKREVEGSSKLSAIDTQGGLTAIAYANCWGTGAGGYCRTIVNDGAFGDKYHDHYLNYIGGAFYWYHHDGKTEYGDYENSITDGDNRMVSRAVVERPAFVSKRLIFKVALAGTFADTINAVEGPEWIEPDYPWYLGEINGIYFVQIPNATADAHEACP